MTHQAQIDPEIDEHRPERALPALRCDRRPVEAKPGVFRSQQPDERDLLWRRRRMAALYPDAADDPPEARRRPRRG